MHAVRSGDGTHPLSIAYELVRDNKSDNYNVNRVKRIGNSFLRGLLRGLKLHVFEQENKVGSL